MYATELARQGNDLVIVSNQEKELQETSDKLTADFGVTVTPLYRNLATPQAAEELHQYCIDHQLEIDILINNAGVFFFNELTNTDIRPVELMLSLHVVTVTKHSNYCIARMYTLEMKCHHCVANLPKQIQKEISIAESGKQNIK